MAGSTVHVAAPFAPVPPVIEAELILSTDQA